MNKTVLTLGIIGAGLYLARDKFYQWLNRVSVGFKKLESIHLDWQRSTVKPVIWILNGNKQPVLLKRISGRVVYPTINATFDYANMDLLLAPGQKVDAAFTIEFENEDPFVLLADRLQKKSPIPVEGAVEVVIKGRAVELPFSYDL